MRLPPSWVIWIVLAVALAFMAWGLHSHDSGWAIVGATTLLAAMTYVLAIHTERLAKATERTEALEAARQKRLRLEAVIDAATELRDGDANGIVQVMAGGYVPDEADSIHTLATNADLIDDKETRQLVEKWSNLLHTYPRSEIVAVSPRVAELQKDYQIMKDRLPAEVLRWDKEFKT